MSETVIAYHFLREDMRPRRGIEASRAYARGETDAAAWAAARDARAAAWDAEKAWQRQQFEARFGALFAEVTS